MTFSEERVIERLSRRFVCVWKNIRPTAFGDETYRGNEKKTIEALKPGAGATNICAFVATPDGVILTVIQGYAPAETFLNEIEFGLKAGAAASEKEAGIKVQTLYKERSKEFQNEERDGFRRLLAANLAKLEKNPLRYCLKTVQESTVAGLKP